MYTVAVVLLIFALLTSFLSKADFAGEEDLRPTKVAVPGLLGIGMYDGSIWSRARDAPSIFVQPFTNLLYAGDWFRSTRHVFKWIRSSR